MKRWLMGSALILVAVFLFSFAFFSLSHRAKPEWLVDVYMVLFAGFVGLLVYYVIRRIRS